MKNPAEPSYGKRLQEARRNAGLSTETVAESLRLDSRFVVALEEEDTEVLPAPTYTRGYIRAYAQLVRCDAEELIAQYNIHAGGEPALTDVTAAAIEKPGGDTVLFWITCVVVGALIALLALWAYDSLQPQVLRIGKESPAEQTAPPEPFEVPAGDTKPEITDFGLSGSSDSTAQTVQDPVLQVRESDVPDNTLSGPEMEVDPGVEDSPPVDLVAEISDEVAFVDEVQSVPPENGNEIVPVAPSGSDVLRLDFQGRSWAEVVDANGVQMAYGLFQNQVLRFEGRAPFRVMLGDATQVEVAINGAGVGLSSYIRWNKTAYLSVGGSGKLSD